MTGFQIGGFGFFLPFRQIFSKLPTKSEPFGFHFSTGADKNLRVRIPVILGGAGGGGGGGGGNGDNK